MPLSQNPNQAPRLRAHASWTALAIPLALSVLSTVAAPVHAQTRPAAPLQEAYFAWDEGRYIEAMDGYLRALRSPAGASLRREAAMLTGEIHPVAERDDDGRFLRVSPDGGWVAWARQISGRWETRIEPAGGGARITLPAQQVALSGGPETLAAYWAPSQSADGVGGTLVIRNLAHGEEVSVSLPALRLQGLAFRSDVQELFLTLAPDPASDRIQLFRAQAPHWEPEIVMLSGSTDIPVVLNPAPLVGGRHVLLTIPNRSPLPAGSAGASVTQGPALALADLGRGAITRIEGMTPSVAQDGSRLAWVEPAAPDARDPARALSRILALDLRGGTSIQAPQVVIETPLRLGDPAVSPSGDRIAFKAMPHVDWEIFVVEVGSGAILDTPLDPGTAADPPAGLRRVTREAQHDQFPAWIDDARLLALKGEARHRRSYLYDLTSGEHYRLFHNNTLRTIAPEYEWIPSPDGRFLLINAERDGNTISPERGVFTIDLSQEVTLSDLIARLEANRVYERELRAEGEARFAPLHDEVARVTEAIQTGRVHHYATQLYQMGSKFIGQPGNLEATEYLRETLEGWGYEVTLEWFEPRGFPAANVIARLPGTENPELIYAISSHFDSVLPSPGADDNTSGTTALLEAARVLKDHPRRATLEFAFLTAEEAGLLGAREYVRRMVEEGRQLVGVLNNDMIGWTRSHRLDNTIRYSNPGIMRIQHAAAMQYSDLITYDALYYRGTDGAVFYEAYGDIVGGIGSYPVLGNPHYHQRTDAVETINHRLVAEVSRTTVASIMLLADSPSRVQGMHVAGRTPAAINVAWEPSPERGVTGYRVQIRSPQGAIRELGVRIEPDVALTGVRSGDTVEVRAIGAGGLEGWDWARLIIP